MRYMMFIKHREDFDMSKVPQSLFGAMDKFIAESAKEGVFIDGAGLQPSKAGHTVRLAKGKITTTDGPFTESKEIVGGYSIMECRDDKHALKCAQDFMELHRVHWPDFEGECEVRPFEAGPPAA
jgi:hypothetical protein